MIVTKVFETTIWRTNKFTRKKNKENINKHEDSSCSWIWKMLYCNDIIYEHKMQETVDQVCKIISS